MRCFAGTSYFNPNAVSFPSVTLKLPVPIPTADPVILHQGRHWGTGGVLDGSGYVISAGSNLAVAMGAVVVEGVSATTGPITVQKGGDDPSKVSVTMGRITIVQGDGGYQFI